VQPQRWQSLVAREQVPATRPQPMRSTRVGLACMRAACRRAAARCYKYRVTAFCPWTNKIEVMESTDPYARCTTGALPRRSESRLWLLLAGLRRCLCAGTVCKCLRAVPAAASQRGALRDCGHGRPGADA
jgi:hypothetical protein